MASSPVERISGASTPTLLAMSSFSTNRLHDELTGLKRWRQMYDAAMNEKNEELQKLQLINQRQAQALNDSIVQLEQQTMTINSMKQNETILEKKVVKLEEVHQILKKNLSKLEKTVSQCEFVRLDLERMYEHQERMVKNLSDRVDSTIETKIEHLQSQLKMMEELHDRVRQELSKEKAERAEENHQTFELRTMMNKIEGEYRQLQFIHNNAQMKINELTEELNKSQHFIETLILDHDKELKTKLQEIETLNKRIDHLVLKIDTNQSDFFNLQETNRILQERLDEMKEKSMEHAQSHHSEVEACRTELENREKENQALKETNLQLNEKMIESQREIDELKEKNRRVEREIEEMKSNWDKQINTHLQQTTEHDHRFEQLMKEFQEKERTIDDLKEKHRELMEKMELIEDDMVHLSKENEDLRTQNHLLLQETDERNEQIKQKDVIVEATNIEIGEKEKEIEELKSKLSSLEERFSKNQNLLTSLRSSMGEKDAKIKRLEQGTNVNASPSSSVLSRPNAVRRTGSVQHPLTINQNRTSTPNSISQQSKINSREKRMLPPSTSADLTSTPKKILRLSQNKPNNEQDNAPYIDDDRDEVASNTSVASLFEYLKKI